MTDEEALQEAERRWPEDGAIQRWNHPLPKKPCLVGRRIRGPRSFTSLAKGTPGRGLRRQRKGGNEGVAASDRELSQATALE